MRSFSRLLGSTALIAVAAPALADVTRDDVWANTLAYFESLGGTVTADLIEDGATTRIEGLAVAFALPFGLGQIEGGMSTLEMVDNGDGTVTFRYPDRTVLTFGGEIPGQGSGSLAMTITGGFDMRATGTPGDITYSYDVPEYGLTLDSLDVEGVLMNDPGMEMLADLVLDGAFTIRGTQGEMRITEGDLIETAINASYSGMDYTVTFEVPGSLSGFQNGTVGPSSSTITASLPAGGVALMELASALQAGMAFSVEGRSTDLTTEQEMSMFGEVMAYTRDTTADSGGAFRMSDEGLFIDVSATEYAFDQLDPELGIPLKGRFNALAFELGAPLTGGPDPQPFTFGLTLDGFALDDSIWAMFDPGSALPRDPASLRIDLTGEMGTTMNLLDIPKWMEIEATGENPFSIHALDVQALTLDAIGARMEATAGFTFDMGDLETFDGVPAPTGAVDATITGFASVLEALVGMGVITDRDAMAANLGVGMVARPAGDGTDTLVSKIEIDGAAGTVTANGQRLR